MLDAKTAAGSRGHVVFWGKFVNPVLLANYKGRLFTKLNHPENKRAFSVLIPSSLQILGVMLAEAE
jgi:hypothetical protein